MTALPQDAVADLQQRIAELERQLQAAVDERDAAIDRQTASALVSFRLKNELRAVSDREKASAEILNAIANTQGDAEHALQRIAETTANFFNAAGVTIRIADGETWVRTVRVGAGSLATGAQPAADFATRGHNVPGTVYQENRQIHIPDLDNIDSSMAHWPATAARAAGIRTICGTPLRRRDKAIGAMIVYRDRLAPFTDDERALQQGFADQAVIAIENARLFNETQQALTRQDATAEILRTVASTPGNAEHSLRQIAETSARLFGAPSVTLFLAENGEWTKTYRFGASSERIGSALPLSASPVGGRNLPGRVVADDRQIHVPDLDNLPPEMADWPGLPHARVAGTRSACGTPLRREGKAIGALLIFRDRLAPFTAQELALQQSFADQAVIAIENARLFNETREALERQTATADILKVIASSPSDVQPVFDAIAQSAKRLLGGFSSTVYRFVGGMAHLEAFTPTTADADEILQSSFPRPVANFAAFQATEAGEVMQIPDTEVPTYELKEIARARGYRSMLFVPLLNKGTSIGLIAVTRVLPGHFVDHHVQLLKTFADQAVIAIENTRLFNETQEALERQTATADILKVIASSPSDVQPVFEAIASSSKQLIGGYSATVFRFVDGIVNLAAYTPISPEADTVLKASFPRPTANLPFFEMAKGGEVVQEADSETNPDKDLRDLARARGFRSSLFAPLMSKGAPVGLIVVTRKEPGTFAEHHVQLLETFADQAVIAIENARLFNETQEALERQTATADILKVIASSPSDVQPVFEAIAASANRLIGGYSTSVHPVVDDMVHVAAFTAIDPASDAAFEAAFPMPRSEVLAVALIERGETTQIADAETADAQTRRLSRARGWRSVTFTPLMNRGTLIGFIGCTRRETGVLADHHVQLLKTFADQAVIAIENVRLFNETKEALERQTATADILKVIAGSPSDVQPVFEAIVNSAAQLFEPCAATITTLKDSKLHWNAAAASIPGLDVELTRTVYPIPFDLERAPSARAILERRIIELPDVESPDTPEFTRKAAAAGRFRSITFVPLVDQEQGIGTIIFTHPQVGHRFSERQLALMQTFADQAVIAIKNTQLFNETREALERQTATAEILKVIASSPSDTTPVFDAIAASANRLLGGFSTAVFRFLDGSVHLAASTPVSPDADSALEADFPKPVDEFEPFQLAQQGKPFPILDTEEIPFAPIKEIARLHGFRSMLFVPLMNGGVPIGIISVTRSESGAFSPNHVQLLQTFADQAVIAIENVRLFNETKEALERQTATAEILKVIASSPSDTTPVFDAIAASANRLIGGFSTAVFRFIDGVAHLTAFTPTTPTADDVLRSHFPRPVEGFEAAEMAHEGKPRIVADTEEATDHRLREIGRARGFRSMLFAPLMNNDIPIGLISVTRVATGSFADHHVQLLKTFADQAVIAIENTRLFNAVQERTVELTEALEQQTATAEVLGVISSSAGDLAPVFDAMLGKAMQLCGANFGVLNTYDGKAFHTAATYGLPLAYDEYRRSRPLEYGPGTGVYRLLQGEPFVELDDLRGSEAYVRGDPNRRALVDLGGARCLLAVPLLKDERVAGTVMIFREENRPFSQKQIALLQQFAAQAVIAIENTRLLRELRESTEDLTESLQQQTATSEVLQIISSSPGDLVPVFDKMLENATRVCGAEFGSMLLAEDGGFRQAALYNPPAALAAARTGKLLHHHPLSAPATAMRNRQVVQIEDVRASEAYLARSPATVQIAELGGARTIAVVPMLRDAEAIGSITVYRQEVKPFSDKQIELLTNFARQAVIAIENARLLRELRQRTDDLSESLEQQTAISDILGVISSSPGDIKPVFQTVARHAAEICEAQVVDVLTVEDDRLAYVAHFGDFERLDQGESAPLNRDTVMGRSIVDKLPVHIADLQGPDHDFALGREYALRFGHRTTMAVPLIRDDHALGTILIRRADVRPFEEKHIALLKMFADQAVIAIENARLLRELRQRTDDLSEALVYQTGSSNILKVIASSPTDVGPALKAIVDSACEICNAYDAVVLLKDGDDLVFSAHHGPIPSNWARWPINRQWVTGRAMLDKATQHVHDVLGPEGNELPGTREIVRLDGHRTVLSVPLLREGEAIGAIVLRRMEVQPFNDKQIGLLQSFADQAVIAISNVRLFEQVQERTRELSRSLDDLRTAQDRLVQTEKLASLGQLTAGIAHEIKNPLNFVNNFAALSAELTDELNDILKPAELAEKLRQDVNELTGLLKDNLSKVVQHGKRADSIVKNMLLHSREGAGEHRPADINALVDESLNLAYHGARAEKPQFNVTLQRDFDPKAGQVEVFPQEITRVLLNLISNGFYAVTRRKADNGGAGFEPLVTATTRGSDDHVEIRIRDNGTGIPPEVKEKMFNPFFTTKPAGEGTGLGLSMSHDIIVKQHGGTIEVETEPGVFTEFRLVLPRTSRANGNR